MRRPTHRAKSRPKMHGRTPHPASHTTRPTHTPRIRSTVRDAAPASRFDPPYRDAPPPALRFDPRHTHTHTHTALARRDATYRIDATLRRDSLCTHSVSHKHTHGCASLARHVRSSPTPAPDLPGRPLATINTTLSARCEVPCPRLKWDRGTAPHVALYRNGFRSPAKITCAFPSHHTHAT